MPEDAAEGRCASCGLTVKLLDEAEAEALGIPVPGPRPLEEPLQRPIEEPVEEPVEEPIEEPVENAVDPRFDEVPCPACEGPLLLAADDEEGICPHCHTPLRFAPGDDGMAAALQARNHPHARPAAPAFAPDRVITGDMAPIVECDPVAPVAGPAPSVATSAGPEPVAGDEPEPQRAEAVAEPAAASVATGPAMQTPRAPAPPVETPADPRPPPASPTFDPLIMITTESAPLVEVRSVASDMAMPLLAQPPPGPVLAAQEAPSGRARDTPPLAAQKEYAPAEHRRGPEAIVAAPEPMPLAPDEETLAPIGPAPTPIHSHVMFDDEEPLLAELEIEPEAEPQIEIGREAFLDITKTATALPAPLFVAVQGPSSVLETVPVEVVFPVRAPPVAAMAARVAEGPPLPITPDNAPVVEVSPAKEAKGAKAPEADAPASEEMQRAEAATPVRRAKRPTDVERVVDADAADGIPLALVGKKIKDRARAPVVDCPKCTYPFRHHAKAKEVQCPHCQAFFEVVPEQEAIAAPAKPPRKIRPKAEPLVAETGPAETAIEEVIPVEEELQAEPLVAKRAPPPVEEPLEELAFEPAEEEVAPESEPPSELERVVRDAPEEEIALADMAMEEEMDFEPDLALEPEAAPMVEDLGADEEPRPEPALEPVVVAPRDESEEAIAFEAEPIVEGPVVAEREEEVLVGGPIEHEEVDFAPEPEPMIAERIDAEPEPVREAEDEIAFDDEPPLEEPEPEALALGPEPGAFGPALEPITDEDDLDAMPSFEVALGGDAAESAGKRRRRR